ncbi:hypothetical protein OROMI_021060 [Orobanche minor]
MYISKILRNFTSVGGEAGFSYGEVMRVVSVSGKTGFSSGEVMREVSVGSKAGFSSVVGCSEFSGVDMRVLDMCEWLGELLYKSIPTNLIKALTVLLHQHLVRLL